MWTLRVVRSEVEVEFTSVDAWARSIWLYGSGRSGSELGFRYRPAGQEQWIDVADVEVDGGSFKARVSGLEPSTAYQVVAFSGQNESAVADVTTEAAPVLENGGLESWSKPAKSWMPYADGAAPYWGSGNPGATTLGDAFNLTTPSTDTRPGSAGTTSASLQSMYPNMAGIGKFAAGNLFLGRFAQTVGTNGIVHFGRPYSGHPTALHGYFKYKRGDINRVGSSPADMNLAKGDPDNGAIYIAVGDWTAEEYGGDPDSDRHARYEYVLLVVIARRDRLRRDDPHGERRRLDGVYDPANLCVDFAHAYAPDRRMFGFALGRLLHGQHRQLHARRRSRIDLRIGILHGRIGIYRRRIIARRLSSGVSVLCNMLKSMLSKGCIMFDFSY